MPLLAPTSSIVKCKVCNAVLYHEAAATGYCTYHEPTRVKLEFSTRVWIGVDPGIHGGLAFIGNNSCCSSSPVPATERDILNWMLQFNTAEIDCFAIIERVSGWIGGNSGAHDGQPGSAMFKFGQSYGGLRMALIGANISFDEVMPQKWQKAMGVIKQKGENRTLYKNRLKQKAQQLFPREKVTLATADALLLAEYCRRKNEGLL